MSELIDTTKEVKVVIGAGTPTTAQASEMDEGVVVLDLDGRLLTKDQAGNLRLIADANSRTLRHGSNANGAFIVFDEKYVILYLSDTRSIIGEDKVMSYPLGLKPGAPVSFAVTPIHFSNAGAGLILSSNVRAFDENSITIRGRKYDGVWGDSAHYSQVIIYGEIA